MNLDSYTGERMLQEQLSKSALALMYAINGGARLVNDGSYWWTKLGSETQRGGITDEAVELLNKGLLSIVRTRNPRHTQYTLTPEARRLLKQLDK